MTYYICKLCGAVISDNDLVPVVYEGKKHFVCQECMDRLIDDSNIVPLPEDEIDKHGLDSVVDRVYDRVMGL